MAIIISTLQFSFKFKIFMTNLCKSLENQMDEEKAHKIMQQCFNI